MSDLDSSIPECFRVIPGFPRYAINEHGHILSVCGRGFGAKINRDWANASRLTTKADKHGYHYINLYRDGICRQVRVHMLVITVFVGPRPSGMECRHLDGCKDNNHVSNLAWGTKRENEQDKCLHGTTSIGEKNPRAKLNANQVLEIRMRAANGEQHVDIAKDFRVTPVNISQIVCRRSWRHIPEGNLS